MKKKTNKLPDFNTMTRAEEAAWFDTHDLGEYADELTDVDVTVELQKPKEETLVLRLQKNVKDKLEHVAKQKGLNVSALARMWLMERLHAGHQ